jgi:3-oxoacyl-[acyl-carrier protein] reductase
MSDSLVHLILGATGGIGQALAQSLHSQGHRVVLAASKEAKLKELSQTLGGAPYLAMDARRSGEVDASVALAISTYGRLDGMVNCVGNLSLRPLSKVTDEGFDEDLAINLKSSFYAVRAATAAMDPARGGSIVLLSSAAARYGMPNHESIAAAKAGVLGLMLSAAASHAHRQIRVNAVAPGLIETELTKPLMGNELVANASKAMHPVGHVGEPQHVADMIAFLLDPKQIFITGQTFGVDGGLATLRPKR